MSSKNVNLVDALLALASGEPVMFFSSAGDLRKYTKDSAKYFNRKLLEPGSPLKELLKVI